MFNFFKKNKTSKCYLRNSKVIEKKIIDENNLSSYPENLNDFITNDDKELKEIILNFLKPNKISLLKFNLNLDYYEQLNPVDFRFNHRHIAPSLKILKENAQDVMSGYPAWFFAAFPDVILWAKSKKINDDALLICNSIEDGKSLKYKLLKELIEKYSKNTGKDLECKYFD